MQETKAVIKLRAWMAKNGHDQKTVAEAFHVHPSTISRIMANGLTPMVTVAVRIEDATGRVVRCRDWVA